MHRALWSAVLGHRTRCQVLTSGGALAVLAACALLVSDQLTASDPDPAVTARTDPHSGIDLSASPASVAVGDSITITLTYRWPHGWSVDRSSHEPDPSGAFADEFVTSFPPPERLSTGEEERRVFTLVLSARHSGSWSLPRPTLSVVGPSGRRDMTAPEVIIQVGIEAKPPDLPAARPAWVHPITSENPGTAWWIYGLGFLAAGMLTVMALMRRRSATPPLTPFEVFANDLTSASATGDGKEAGARLSLALRRYVGSLFAFDGPGSTTRETMVFLRGRLRDDEYRDLVRLLDQLDSLRWSPDDLPVSTLRSSVDAARSWCNEIQRRLDAEAQERLKGQSDAPTAGAPASMDRTS